MNEIKLFTSHQFGEIRTATNESGDPLFCLADCAKALGYLRPADAVNDHCKGVAILPTPTNGGIQQIKFGKESEVYRLVMRSKLPDAEKFQDWVCEEVLPSIRKHGAYMTQSTIEKALTDPDTLIQLAQILKEERRQRELAQKQLEYQAPVIKYANEVLSSTSGHTATTIGAELNMSAITLNELLVKAHFIRKTGKKGEYSLCAAHQGRGYVNTTTFKYEGKDGGNRTKIDIHFTEAGRMKIHKITNQAIEAGVLKVIKGRLFINHGWVPAEKQA